MYNSLYYVIFTIAFSYCYVTPELPGLRLGLPAVFCFPRLKYIYFLFVDCFLGLLSKVRQIFKKTGLKVNLLLTLPLTEKQMDIWYFSNSSEVFYPLDANHGLWPIHVKYGLPDAYLSNTSFFYLTHISAICSVLTNTYQVWVCPTRYATCVGFIQILTLY